MLFNTYLIKDKMMDYACFIVDGFSSSDAISMMRKGETILYDASKSGDFIKKHGASEVLHNASLNQRFNELKDFKYCHPLNNILNPEDSPWDSATRYVIQTRLGSFIDIPDEIK